MSLALNEEALTLLFVGRLLVAVDGVVVCCVCCCVLFGEPPHLNWSSAMFRKRRTDNDEQTTEAGRDYHEVEAS